MIQRLFAIFAILLAPALAAAQPLADRVPADAMVYLGWQGSEHMPASYQKSHLKGFLDATALPELFDRFLPQLIQKLGAQEPQAGMVMKMITSIGGPMFRHPTAIYFGGLDIQAGQPATPKFALLCEAGKDADALVNQLKQLLAQAGEPPFPVKIFNDGDLVVLAVGFDNVSKSYANKDGPKPITANATFNAALKHGRAEAVSIVYIDAEAILAMVDKGVAAYEQKDNQQSWAAVRDSLALNGIKRIISTSGFDGAEWASETFINAPAPRKGLAAWFEGGPLSDATLKAIPKTATWMSAGRLNLSKGVTALRDIAGQIDPNAQKMVDQGLGGLRLFLAMDIQKDFLDTLGEEWAIYTDPASAGVGPMGITIVNHLTRPADTERGLEKLEMAISNLANSQLIREKMQISFERLKSGETNIHYISLPFVAPSWAISDGNLYLALYPQVVAAAVDNAKGKSILENEDFIALRKRLGGEKASGVSFTDLPRSAAESYQTFLGLTQLGLGFADLFGVKSPQMILPPYHKLLTHLTPAGAFSWTDDEGWHSKSVSPFPGSELIGSQQQLAIGGVALSTSIMLPALNAAKERANRVYCMSNLRQIGQGALLYANDNKGKYPPNLGTMVKEVDMNVEVFVCPSGNTQIPDAIRRGKPDVQAAWVNANADYVYLGATMKGSDPAEMILVHEKLGNHERDGINMLFNDGHVEWMRLPDAIQLIEKQTGKKIEQNLPKRGQL